jgi:Inner membrane component of T3SS, periplasmic domain
MANTQSNQIQEDISEEIVELKSQQESDTNNIDQQTADNSTEPATEHNSNRAILFVMSGLHKGAGASVVSETTIGSDFDNDLILTDDEIANRHLILTPIESGLNYAIQLTCVGESLIVNGDILLTKDQKLTIYDSCLVTLGAVNINITIHKSSKFSVAYKKYMKPQIHVVENIATTTKKYLSPSVILSDVRNIILTILVIALIAGGVIYLFTMKKNKEPFVSKYASIENIKTVNSKEIANKSELHIDAKNDLSYVLGKYDLQSRLDLTIYKNIIYVKGSINQYELANWTKVLNWFDTTYGASKINLVSMVTVNNGLRRTISFKAIVAYGTMPYVVSWTGDRFKTGATLPGGWIILKISDEGVIVKDAVDNRVFLVNHIRSTHGEAVPDFIE